MLNKVMLIGNLGDDPYVRHISDGLAVTNISLATSRRWKDKQSGEPKEHTEWHRVIFFNRLAEIAGKYLRKGSKVYVDGRIQTRKWQDQNGQDRYSTEIVAEQMQMLNSSNGDNGDKRAQKQADAYQQSAPVYPGQPSNNAPPMADYPDDFDDDIPF